MYSVLTLPNSSSQLNNSSVLYLLIPWKRKFQLTLILIAIDSIYREPKIFTVNEPVSQECIIGNYWQTLANNPIIISLVNIYNWCILKWEEWVIVRTLFFVCVRYSQNYRSFGSVLLNKIIYHANSHSYSWVNSVCRILLGVLCCFLSLTSPTIIFCRRRK